MRTVIWDFACEPIAPEVCARPAPARRRPARRVSADRLAPLLDRFELDAVQARLGHLLATGEYPDADRDYHSYPWPTI